MSVVTVPSWQQEFGVDRENYPGFFSDKEALRATTSQAHVLRQAFDLFKLDGILCSDNAPLIYFKQVAAIQPANALELHRKFWNHGGAPILVLIAPEQVYVYSGFTRPEPDKQRSESPSCLIDILNRVATGLQEFLLSVESGSYFGHHAGYFNPDNRVDRELLHNLRDTRNLLREKSPRTCSRELLDDLLCRLVFACYLFDRGVIGQNYLADLDIHGCSHLRDVLQIRPLTSARHQLYSLFRKLGDDFNGDLFSDDLLREEEYVENLHLSILSDFFQGTQVSTGQLTFWPYDFAYIPIETISAIYEDFLKDDELRDGAFYTPRFLAEVVLDTALQDVSPLIGKTYLDPSCGSGIFLVGIFNRLAIEWLKANPNARNDKRARELMDLLRSSLFGVDRSPTACRIAAFSLYLAYLDQLSPRDIQDLRRNGRALPRLVVYSDAEASRGSELFAGNIYCSDFFDPKSALPQDFDVVVGNPPWGSLASGDTHAGRWCAREGRTIPDRQIAAAFVWKVGEHTDENGPISLLLPHGLLFNHSPAALRFQRNWIASHQLERVMNLTDLRFLLFREAIHPAIVVRFRRAPKGIRSHPIEYWVPKADWATAQAEVITVGHSDRVNIDVRSVLDDLDGADAPQIWNRYFWATPRDLRFLDRLCDYPRLRDHVRSSSDRSSSKSWIRAEGFQPVGRSDDPVKAKTLSLPSDRFIEARSIHIDLFLRPEDCMSLGTREIVVREKSNTNTRIFRAPHVLITKGFKRIAFADFDVSFRHAIRGIHGPIEDRDMLMFLAAYLRTELSRYFMFHTSSNWGVYRPEVHVNELLRLPFPFPEDTQDPGHSRDIVRQVAGLIETLSEQATSNFLVRDHEVASASSKIESLVAEYFNVQAVERVLVQDTLSIIVPSVQPSRSAVEVPTLEMATSVQCRAYTDRLCKTLNGWSRSSDFGVTGGWLVSTAAGVAVVMLEKVLKNYVNKPVTNLDMDILRILCDIRDAVPTKQGSVNPVRGLIVFHDSQLYIVKSAARVHWTQTAALNDADTVAATLLFGSPMIAS